MNTLGKDKIMMEMLVAFGKEKLSHAKYVSNMKPLESHKERM